MPELKDDDLNALFRAAGHKHVGEDLTARIMARVAVTPIHRPAPTPPLIGRRGWVLIVSLLALPLVIALLVAPGASIDLPFLSTSILERFSELRLPSGPWPLWTVGLSATALLLLLLDRFLGSQRHQRS
ncbi:MAG: hypothetical protein KF905_14400 [Flavobacteriales bacterium]|nr:hypothetical protein [Flavobacteriales bacterium]